MQNLKKKTPFGNKQCLETDTINLWLLQCEDNFYIFFPIPEEDTKKDEE